MSTTNFTALEKKAGQKAATTIRKGLKSQIRSLFETTQGNSQLLKATATAKMKGPELQRIAIKMPYYGFMQHYGFDGVKSNSVSMRLVNATNFINDAVNTNNALETLVTEIAEIRGDEVISKINF